ncbi:MAG: sigma-70 family RNA polymerase sigma factor [Deltaproteobacteria bacterium]|nr:sigma-70 family RNA polymerase sigma factor [Deltaproteobacteria bacterium]
MTGGKHDITALLQRGGDDEELLSVVYGELHRLAAGLMRGERAGHTLQPTVLVHEAWFRLVGQRDVDWQGRGHFFAIAARLMRRILVDHARARRRQKRGGDAVRISLDDDLPLSVDKGADVLAVHDALELLATIDERQAKIVELRFFRGLSVDEVAAVLSLSKRTIEADWTMAKAWLRRELSA